MNKIERQAIFSFTPFYYMLGANLVSLLYGDVSVMSYGCFIELLYSPSLKLIFFNRFDRQKQENDKIKF